MVVSEDGKATSLIYITSGWPMGWNYKRSAWSARDSNLWLFELGIFTSVHDWYEKFCSKAAFILFSFTHLNWFWLSIWFLSSSAPIRVSDAWSWFSDQISDSLHTSLYERTSLLMIFLFSFKTGAPLSPASLSPIVSEVCRNLSLWIY